MGLLEIRDLHVSYGKVEALHGISLDVGEGEIVALLGSNGAGKTTTLRAISGLIRPRAGQITLDGQLLNDLPAHRIVALGLGHVPEGRRIFGSLTIEENLRLGGYLIRNDAAALDERMEKLFETFPRLRERRAQLAGTLSGGEQQMLAMARALMSRPALVCMDEPTMGLSPLYVDKVLELIQTVNQQGVTFFMVEQNASLALEIAHRGYVLQTGRVVLEGDASALLRDERIRDAYLGGPLAAGTAS